MEIKTTLILLFLCFASILLISSEAATRNLAEAGKRSPERVSYDNGNGGYDNRGNGGYDNRGNGGYDRGYDNRGNGGNYDRGFNRDGQPRGGENCRYGCCRRDDYGCRDCCNYGEVPYKH